MFGKNKSAIKINDLEQFLYASRKRNAALKDELEKKNQINKELADELNKTRKHLRELSKDREYLRELLRSIEATVERI